MRSVRSAFMILLVLAPLSLTAQTTVSTKGRDFWFTFMKNDPSTPPPQMNIFITADSATTASVFVGTTLVQNVSIPAGGSQRVDLTGGAATQAYQTTSNIVLSNRAVHVVSQKDVTVYAFNTLQFSTDACIIYPTPVLGDEYVTACTAENTPNQRRSQVAIVGVANGTIVEITPRTAVFGPPSRPAGVPYTITLNQGDVYQFQSFGGDLTGSRIRVLTQNGPCNPIAVFSGHQRTVLPLPGGNGGHDHLIEQIPPTRSLGQNFVVMPLQSSNPSGLMMIRIIASEPNTQITFNGTPHTLTNIGDFREERPNINLAASITANKPVLVAQYAMSANTSFSSSVGDPFMAIVPPVEQFIDKFTYNAFVPQVPGQTPAQTTLWTNNLYLNVLANTADIGAITVGGVSIASMGTNPAVAPARLKLQTVGATGLSFATVRVAPGVYVVDASAGQGCSGLAYGLAQVDSYGFAGGSRITNLRASIQVMDAPACPGRPIAIEGFSRDSNVITQWLWSFPHDASTFNTKRITKTFPAPGTYQAVLVLVKNGCALDTIVEDIEITTPISTQFNITPQPACEGTNVVITASSTGSVAPYTYQWTAIDANGIVGSTTDSVLTVRHDAGGTFRYRLTVTDALGCTGVRDTAVVFLNGPEITEMDTMTMCRGDMITITSTVTPATGIVYQWSAVNAADDSTIIGDRTQASVQIRGVVSGTHPYQLRVTDQNGCIDEEIVDVYVGDVPTIVNNGSDPVVRCLETNIPPITIGDSLAISGGVQPYTFTWSVVSGDATSITGPTNQQITTVRPLFTTVYRLTVRGADPRITCEATIEIAVQVRLVPDANAGEDRVICICSNVNGVSIGENAQCGRAPYTYSWTPTTGLSNPNSTTTGVTQANPQQPTTYILTVRDADGGVNSDTVTVLVEPCPVVEILDVPTLCEDRNAAALTTIVELKSTPFSVQWTPTTGLDDPSSIAPVVTMKDSTYTATYIAVVTSSYGCIGSDTITVRRSFGHRVVASSTSSCESDTICRGDTVRMTAASTGGQAPYTYSWRAIPTDPTMQFTPNGNLTAQPLVRTSYIVASTDAFGCEANDTVVVCVDPVPNAFAGADTTICASDVGFVPILRGAESTCGQAPFVYQWSPSDKLSIPNPNAPWQADLRPTQTTAFILRVTDINGQGASTEDTIVVTVRPPITISITPDSVDLCRGVATEALVATASGGAGPYIYTWFINGVQVQSTPPVGSSELPATFLAALTANARVIVVATDTLGCDGTDTIDIVVREAPTLSMTSNFTICPCDSVQIGALAQGGTPYADGSYRYRWMESIEEIQDDRSSISNDTAAVTWVSPRTTTTYMVVAVDSAGCASLPFSVTVTVDRPGTGTILQPATVRADPRSENVDIPIDVVEGLEQFACLPDRLEFTLSYLEQLFDPFPTSSNGTIIENVVEAIPDAGMNLRRIRVRISPAPNLTKGARITTISGKALIGEPGETMLALSDITMIWDCDSIDLDPSAGMLTLDSLCVTDSVARLLGVSAGQIRNVYPNPTSGSVTISIERRVAVASILTIIDASGTPVHTQYLDAPQPGGETRTQVPLDLDLPNGAYRAVWRTPSTVSVHPFTIIR